MTLKEQLFSIETITYFTNTLKSVYLPLDEERFISRVLFDIKDKELKERGTVITLLLKEVLPSDFIEATSILKEFAKIAKPNMFVHMGVLEYVEFYGCNDQYVDHSLELIEEFTKLFTGEFVIRRFINQYEDKTFEAFMEWSNSSNEDVRRLSSEGIRPKLPWAVKVNIDYLKGAKPLDNLYFDDSRYVTRSVANHLNDISKVDPLFVLNKLKEWKKSNKQNDKEMEYIINHSVRTLVKKGHKETLELLGFDSVIDVEVSKISFVNSEIMIGDSLEFSFNLNSNRDDKFVIDYVITYPTLTKKAPRKVYKLKTMSVKKNIIVEIKSKRAFKEISTRKMREGIHKIEIVINGNIVSANEFSLKTKSKSH